MLVRFAPSPTGLLHMGNLRTALINFLLAKSQGGQFMLRIDDTDMARSKPEYEEGIKQELQWMGLQWDKLEKQSDRFDRYTLAKEKLIADGRLYPCYETPEELDIKRKMLVSRGLPPIYDRSALKLTDDEKAALEAEGRQPHWRFKMDHAPIQWHDLVRGDVSFDGANIADPVLVREDGVPLFTLSTSVDDGEHGITHIIRGEDHVSNTAVQVQVMEALGHTPPIFGHTALLKMQTGKMSKRTGGGDVQSLREEGVFPLVLASYLAKIGSSDAIELAESFDALVQGFDISKLGRAMANYDQKEIDRLNEKFLHNLSFEEAKPLLDDAIDADFWQQIRPNLTNIADTKAWWELLNQPITPVIEDAAFANEAANCIPENGDWDSFIEAVKIRTGRKGKELWMPLRLALSGRADGPELKTLFTLLGRERATKRLKGEAA